MKQETLTLSPGAAGPVECLGRTFPTDQARREHYLQLLAEKLKDPAFRKIEGFPIGKDEDILALSDPPYYTACPNPWLADFVEGYGTPYDPKQPYHREPFAADVSEGKNHPIYTAHSYHTKVPHRAIMRYILHYTQPGDVVFDGFCGTGMTGVAAQLCGDRAEVQELGYRVQDDGTILNEKGQPFSKLGTRRAILNDLAPAASFIAYNYNTPVDTAAFECEADRILKKIQNDYGWMYFTLVGASSREMDAAVKSLAQCKTLSDLAARLASVDGLLAGSLEPRSRARLETVTFFVWSDILSCPECGKENVYWEIAVDWDKALVRKEYSCSSCGSLFGKRHAKISRTRKFDPVSKQYISEGKQVLVFKSYGNRGSRQNTEVSSFDRALQQRIEELAVPESFPVFRLPDGFNTAQPATSHNFQFLHQFYTARNSFILSEIWEAIMASTHVSDRLQKFLRGWFFSCQSRLHKLNRYTAQHQRHVGPLANTLYISSTPTEISPFYFAREKMKENILDLQKLSGSMIAVGDAAAIDIPDESLDYLFVDPPFGGNIMYSELNSLHEAWNGVLTNNKPEAIENPVQRKGVDDYRLLMTKCFSVMHRKLKPGRWITVEFSNSKASIWNAIQTALQEAQFVVSTVDALDKGRGGLHGIIGVTAVKQDLVISAYKPNGGLEQRFANRGETLEGVWDFLRTHLGNLPVIKAKGGQFEIIAERDPRILYDRMVAFYVGHSTPVPMSSAEFQASLAEKFPERDGMYFLPEQVNEYDKKRAQMENIGQLTIFVEDERSAIHWLRNFLKDRPSTYQDIQPDFMQQLGASWKKWEARPELSALLDQNFLCYDGMGDVPSQIHSYLSTQFKELRNLAKDHHLLKAKAKERWYVPDPKKNVDVETLRNKRLLEEFWSYLPEGYSPPALTANKGQVLPGLTVPRPKIPKGKKLKELRTEAVRVGFKHCYQQKDYTTILVVAEMLPESVLNEDEQLQMIFDTAVTRTGGTD
jgi:DNA modification methylase